MCSSRHVRSGTHTGLVAEQPALHALYQCSCHAPAKRLFPAKCVAHDGGNQRRNMLNIGKNNEKSQQNIANCHHGHNHAADIGNAVNSAENNAKCHHRQPHAHPEGIDAEGIFPRGTNRVALYGIECKSESNGNKHGKEDSHPAFSQPLLHIVGRSADKRLFATGLVELCQRRFHKCARRAKQGNEPHPEHRTRTSDGNGGRYTGQIARTDTAGNRHRKRLK